MRPARIAELLAPFLAPPVTSSATSDSGDRGDEEPAALSSAQLQDISTYIDLLLRWNARINLTAIRDPEEIVTRHFGESLFAALRLFPSADMKREGHGSSRAVGVRGENRALAPEDLAADPGIPTSAPSLADIGSGAGFPGLPIKLWAPEIALTLVESSHKKAAFLHEVTRALTLTNVDIKTARAEALTAISFATVTLRAVERFESVLPVAASLVAPAGRLALLIGSAQLDLARATLPSFSWSTPVPVPLSRSRVLAVAHRPQ
jgi:16S rRNA (guanine527-N7)-methyltransferase